MVKSDHSMYAVGYGKPPRHTQFKPGKSGNPSGRPRKTKGFLEILNKEVLAIVTLGETGGKRQRMSMLQAIARQCVRSAARGDLKATTMVLNLLKLCQDDGRDNLGEVLQQLRARHAGLAAPGAYGALEIGAREFDEVANVDPQVAHQQVLDDRP
jgi:hypothetical protein